MQVSIETIKGLERCLMVQVPYKEIEEKSNKRLQELSHKVKMDGFRPGKIPARVLEERYGDAVRQEILNEVLRTTLYEALTQEKVQPAGTPNIEIKVFEKGKPLEYSATFEVYPEIQLVGLNDAEIEQYHSELTGKDLEEVLHSMQIQQASWKEVERPAKIDDQVIIDFEGFIGNEPFEGGQGSNVPLVLGSNSMIPGFEKGIIAAKAQDELDVSVTFPEAYHNKDLAGKEAVFKIKVHNVSERELPEFDDHFAERLGIKEGGMDALRVQLRKTMARELKNAIRLKNKNAVMEKFLEANTAELPKALVEMEMDHMHTQAMQKFGEHAHANKAPEIPKDVFKEQASQRVKLSLLIAEFAKQHDLKADPSHIREIIEEIAEGYDYPDQIISWYYEDQKRLAQFEMVAIEDQVIDKLLGVAHVLDKHIAYQEAVQR